MEQLRRAGEFVVGTAILALGIVLTIKNPWGPAAWDTLHLGIGNHVNLSLGTIIIASSVGLIGITLALGGAWSIRWGTAWNTLLIGLFVDLYLWMGLPDARNAGWGALYLAAGIFCLALGSVVYTRAGYGAGARDGLSLVLSQRLPFTVGKIRLGVETCAALTGWALGGPIGVATLLIVLGTGPTCDLIFRVLGRGRLPNTVRIPGQSTATAPSRR